MSSLVRDMTRRLLEQHWTVEVLAALAAGVGPDGRALPTNE
ncbi:hypothetical protein [Dactylosporangium darangshiense]